MIFPPHWYPTNSAFSPAGFLWNPWVFRGIRRCFIIPSSPYSSLFATETTENSTSTTTAAPCQGPTGDDDDDTRSMIKTNITVEKKLISLKQDVTH